MDEARALRTEVEALLAELRATERAHATLLSRAQASHRQGARNLLHYVTLRQHDLRKLQLGLWRLGLSSLGRIEGHVIDALERVRDRLRDLEHLPAEANGPEDAPGPSWDDSERLLHEHTRALFGPKPAHRHVSIMVTAPSASEVDDAWMERVLHAGTNVLRINAAHEDALAWEHIARTARRVAAAGGHALRIAVDLPGPKLRTVALEEGVRVARFRPERDALGRAITPCEIRLHAADAPSGAGPSMGVPPDVLAMLRAGDELALHDARGKKRVLRITRTITEGGAGAIAETADTTYVVPETELTLRRDGEALAGFRPSGLPMRPHRLTLRVGDALALVRTAAKPPEGMPAIGCTLDAALDALTPGARVLFDDGHVETLVEHVARDFAHLRVTHTAGSEAHLGAEKGVNLPDTELRVPLLAEDDAQALAFAVAHADVVGASFVRDDADVRTLHARLAALGADRIGLMLKIETAHAFARLPAILFAALERAPVGVMIARGDLAIETGYERLAELQEEILWLSEAAHLPVVWATQVLELQTKTGRPSRAEVTDAAMSVRAECVMLNKGPFVVEAVTVLDDILRRMEQHQYKKRSLYRRLNVRLPT